jgi:hypothetical protein
VGVGDRVQGGEKMMKPEIDRIRREAVIDAHAALPEHERAELDEYAAAIVDYVKHVSPKSQMTHEAALEVLAAIGRVV